MMNFVETQLSISTEKYIKTKQAMKIHRLFYKIAFNL